MNGISEPRVMRYVIVLLALLLAASLVMTARRDATTIVTYPTVTAHSTCRGYDSYREAQEAYMAGAYWLDGDGDGRACESLP
ncbi:MAG: hypothetical protein NUW01_05935 [Gemmatimonadaceae bacterium]|nr:hypothetical protein [Gemmatimonadaceae bacterium]